MVEDRLNGHGAKLSYKSLHNIIYEMTDGYCVTDRKGKPLVVRETVDECFEFLNEEYLKKFNVHKKIADVSFIDDIND